MPVTLPAFLHRTVRLSDPDAGTDRAPWTRRLPGWLGPVALAALVLFLRRPDVWLDPQFFQEDGGIFFGENHNHGWRAIFIPHCGYLHVVLRLVAWTAGFLPMIVQPALYNAAAVTLCLAVIARIFRPGIRLPHKMLLALAVVLVPRGSFGEIIGNLTNAQWFLALVPVLMLVEDTAPTGWRAAWDLCQLALVGLSGPFVPMCVPLFAAKWVWVARTRWNALCLGVATLCGVVQAWFVLRQPDLPVAATTGQQWLSFLVWKPIGPLFFGNALGAQPFAPALALAVLLGLVVLLVALTRRRPLWLWPTVVFIVFGGAVLFGSLSRFLRGPEGFLVVGNADRYFFVPRVLLIWSLLPHLGAHAGWRRGLLWLALASAALAAVADLQCQPLPTSDWAAQVGAYERGETDALRNFPGWHFHLIRSPIRGDEYADVLGEAPLQITPPESATRVFVGQDPFLQLRSPKGRLTYEAPVQSRGVTGRYAAAPGTDGAVEFDVFYLPVGSDRVQLLWHGRLDSAHVPADRGAHRFEAAIPPQTSGWIVLGCRPASGEAADGGCWSDVRFR